MTELGSIALAFFTIILAVTLSFVAVVAWIRARVREREAFYRAETLKKLSESASQGAVLEYIRESDRIASKRTRATVRLGGLLLVAVGLGLSASLWVIESSERYYIVGIIPALAGIALLAYERFLLPE